MRKQHLKTLLGITLIALLTGCASTHRLDDDRFDKYGKDPETGQAAGKDVSPVNLGLLGGLIRIELGSVKLGLESSSDVATAAAGYTAASKTAAEAMKAESVRDPVTGEKRVTYGATGLSTEAQEIKGILSEVKGIAVELEKIKNGLPRRTDPPADPSPEE